MSASHQDPDTKYMDQFNKLIGENWDSFNKLVFYSFTLSPYLSPGQAGIQTAHVVATASQKFWNQRIFTRWAEKDLTLVVKKGGGVQELHNLHTRLLNAGLVPSIFYEDESLANAPTAVGVILPNLRELEKKGLIGMKDVPMTEFETLLTDLLNAPLVHM